MRTAKCCSGLLLLSVLTLVLGCGAHVGNASTRAERVNLYKNLSTQIKEAPSEAIKPLNKLAKDEADNAMPHYLLAASDAKLGKWSEALQEVEAGNGAKSCDYPVGEATPYQNLMGLVVLKQFIKDAPTSGLDFDSQKRLFGALRNMGGRIAAGEPRSLTVALVGAVFRRQASHALADVLQRNGHSDEANEARRVEAADERWRQTVKQVSDQTYASGGALDADKLLAKYKFTPSEAKEYATEQMPSPSAREKMLKMSAEMNETIRTLTGRLLNDMPH